MREISSESLLVVKALLFGVIAMVTAALLLADAPSLSTVVLLAICVWSACRLYYFAFYVIEKYVEGTFRYSGVMSAMLFLWRRRRSR